MAFLGGIVILWWGEDQTSRYYRFLDFAQNKYNTITNISNVYQSNDGELVYLTGHAHAETKLEDPLFNIKVEGFKLSRKVRYYQLVEYKTKRKIKIQTVAHIVLITNTPTGSSGPVHQKRRTSFTTTTTGIKLKPRL